jgi:hypothetical protein
MADPPPPPHPPPQLIHGQGGQLKEGNIKIIIDMFFGTDLH